MKDAKYRECVLSDKKYIPGSKPIINQDTESELKSDMIRALLFKEGLLNLLTDAKKPEFIARMMNAKPQTAL
jgi:hypothetical protein